MGYALGVDELLEIRRRILAYLEARSREPRPRIDAWADLEHPSGYRRQEALEALAVGGDLPTLVEVFPRLNDWVPQVRDAALEAVDAFSRRFGPLLLVAALPQFELLSKSQRWERGRVQGRLATLLSSTSGRWALEAGRSAPEAALALSSYRFAWGRIEDSPAQRLLEALDSRWVEVQVWALRAVRDLPESGRAPIFEKGLSSRYPSTRAKSLLGLGLVPETEREERAGFLMDQAPSVRRAAIAALGSAFARRVYLAGLLDPALDRARIEVVLWGMARVGEAHPRVFERLHELRRRGHPKVVAGALEAWARLDPQTAGPLLEEALEEEDLGLVRRAARCLIQGGFPLIAKDVVRFPRIEEPGRAKVAQELFRALSRREQEEALPGLRDQGLGLDPRSGR